MTYQRDAEQIEIGPVSAEGLHQRSCLTGVKNNSSSGCFELLSPTVIKHFLKYAGHHSNESHLILNNPMR